MKILQVMAGAPHGGAETAFVDMCIAMAQTGEQIEVVTRAHPTRKAALQKADIRVHELPFSGIFDIYTPHKMGKIIDAFGPQIVQTWMSRAAQKTPHWDKSRTCSHYLVVSRLGGYYKIKNYKNTDYFTTITPDIKKFLIDQGARRKNPSHK